MGHKETLTDVPDEKVDETVQDFKDAGAKDVTKTKQANGKWTVTALYPNGG